MNARSWTARLPAVYDVLMMPLEAFGLRRLRARLRDGLPAQGRGLEIGTGSGAGAERGARVPFVRSDLSHSMLLRARERAPAIPLVAADVQALPFASESFDWIAGSLLFCEVEDPVRGLREAGRVLRPGGTLHLLEHVRPHGALGVVADVVSRATGPLFGEHFDRATHESVLAAGFTIERAEWWLRGGLVHLVARRGPERDR